MRYRLILAAIVISLSQPILASDKPCEARAAEKSLAGAAKSSFIKKCEKDMTAAQAANSCTAMAADKHLAGAAKNSFIAKCEKGAQAAK